VIWIFRPNEEVDYRTYETPLRPEYQNILMTSLHQLAQGAKAIAFAAPALMGDAASPVPHLQLILATPEREFIATAPIGQENGNPVLRPWDVKTTATKERPRGYFSQLFDPQPSDELRRVISVPLEKF
jgi:hypothetical protein